ncbi:glycoside hydrolase family 2 protein [Neptunicella sp. SCSIO 80796]|uniref:glycoside hydrolase family 2 protein n=1 Tax=Neptunicella plasticusilytica TaxID=3117012 RepID=UPI003A4D7A1E
MKLILTLLNPRRGITSLLVILLALTSSLARAGNSADYPPQLINADWQYLQRDYLKPQQAQASDEWQAISLPHSWNATDTIDAIPGYRRSASWYRKSMAINAKPGDRTALYFEGANFETDVYVNGQRAGGHIGGYVGFEVDISDLIKTGQSNEILVRVSNQYNRNLIPSQKSDFFLYGGITRDVWLKQRPANAIAKVLVSTPSVSDQQASTAVQVSLDLADKQDYQLVASIYDPQEKQVQSVRQTLKKATDPVTVAIPVINQPQLWSPSEPNLYQLKVELQNDKNQLLHSQTETFGYRWFEMRANKGFFINGKRLLLRGTHRHEEQAGVGPAMSNQQHRHDMQMIKDMGANFARLGHYPQDPEVYRAADELGLIIWDELPWCRGGKGGEEWEQNTERLLREQINQNYNHASIAFWSLGNEMYWEEDFVGGGADDVVTPYLQHLNDVAKSLDTSRLTSIRKFYPGDKIVDAFSPSIWAGWYGGSYSQYADSVKKSMAKYPNFIHMEYGGSSHVGRHTETPISSTGIRGAQVSVSEAMNQAVVKSVAKDSDWNENYIVDLFDWHLQVSESKPDFAGNAQWAFKDFGTPLRPENPIPYMNQKGLVDRNGEPKDAYYVFKSYWSDEPFCYIESHTWTHRNGPKEGRDVTVYCNTESAELLLDGQSLGRKIKQKNVVPAGGLVWKVPFKNGVNQLSVKGFNAKKQVAEDATQVSYLIGKHDKFDHIRLTADKMDNGHWLIQAEALDKNNHRVLDYNERAYFSNLTSHGELLENRGTPHQSSIIEMASGQVAIEYMAADKPATIEFRTQNIKGVYITIDPVKGVIAQ